MNLVGGGHNGHPLPTERLVPARYPFSVFWSSVSTLIRLATVVTVVFPPQLPMSQRRYGSIQVWPRISEFQAQFCVDRHKWRVLCPDLPVIRLSLIVRVLSS